MRDSSARRSGSRASTLYRGSLCLLLALLSSACAGYFGPGPPKITVHGIPERPEYVVTVEGGTTAYRMPEEATGGRHGATFSPGAWVRFQDWLRGVLAGFKGNRCAVLAINGLTEEGCGGP